MKIEGIPDGYELARIGSPIVGVDWVVNRDGTAVLCEVEHYAKNWPIIRKIEKPKQYRPFANGNEFSSHPLHDGWIKLSSTAFTKVSQFDQKRFWVNNEEACYTWEDGFNLLKFRDGTPFGIEVTE